MLPRVCSKQRSLLVLLLLGVSNLVLWLSYSHRGGKVQVNSTDYEFDYGLEEYRHLDYRLGAMNFTDGERNETGYDHLIVPDIVHFIILDNAHLNFVTLISMLSVVRHHRPRLLLIHTNAHEGLQGGYWPQLLRWNLTEPGATLIRLKHVHRPRYIYGKPISSVYHASDVVRLRTLRTYGGIFLDNDVYVVGPLHRYRRFEMTLGWPPGQFLGTQILVAHRNARFLTLWYESYREYKANLWYYNAGELPTTKYLEKDPALVHRIPWRFGVHGAAVALLYGQLNETWRKEFDAIHLLARHRSYMVKDQDQGSIDFNEHNILTYNRTYGQMARLVYYNTTELMLDNQKVGEYIN